jgi:NTE family protein
MSSFKVIVLSGGGTKGNIHLGALEQFASRIKNVEKYIGTSIGAIINLLLSVGYTPLEIFTKGYELNAVDMFEFQDVMTSWNNAGIVNMNKYIKLVEDMIMIKLGVSKVPTLKELYQLTNKEIYCTTVNITKQEIEYLSWITVPDMPCSIAVKLSASIPLIFYRQRYGSDFYVDGAVLNNFPIDAISLQEYKPSEILAIVLKDIVSLPEADDLFDISNNRSLKGETRLFKTMMDQVYDMTNYISVIMRIRFQHELESKYREYKDKCHLIKIEWGGSGESNNVVVADQQTKMAMFVKGWSGAIPVASQTTPY